jgi:hypothetical protein
MPDQERKEIEEICRAKGFDDEDLRRVVDNVTSTRKYGSRPCSQRNWVLT